MAGNDHERMGAKVWICLSIWAVAMVVFALGWFTKVEILGLSGDLLSLMALSAAMVGGMVVVAWGSSDVNKI